MASEDLKVDTGGGVHIIIDIDDHDAVVVDGENNYADDGENENDNFPSANANPKTKIDKKLMWENVKDMIFKIKFDTILYYCVCFLRCK